VASGVNNAVSRAGGVLAIAVFSIIMLGAFERSLDDGLASLSLGDDARAEIAASRDELAAMRPPEGLDEGQRREFQDTVDDAFMDGYRLVMLASALIAFASAGIAATTVPSTGPIACGIGGPAPSLQSGGRTPAR
jgi:hypothetical protein